MHAKVTYKAVAADAGKAGHVVVLASDYQGHGTGEASGCNVDNAPSCGIRPIAWSDDVGPELEASILSTTFVGGKTLIDGKRRFERAGGGGAGEDPLKPDAGSTAPDADASSGDTSTADATAAESKFELTAWKAQPKWRFASIANLPAPAQIGGVCRIRAVGESGSKEGTVVAGAPGTVTGNALTCPADKEQNCHGRLASEYQSSDSSLPVTPGPQDRDAWCLNFAADGCQCIPGDIVDPDKPEPPKCRYPTPQYLEIDPRNSWAYLSSDVGLLASPDGGGHWIREGAGPASNPADKFNNFLGAQLITGQFNVPTPGQPTGSYQPYDLNKSPARIRSIGRMSLAFTPCPGENSAPTYTGTSRKRGHLVAALPVEWIAPNGYRASSIFIASQRANCDATVAEPAPGSLVLTDSAHLKLKVLQSGADPEVTAEQLGHPANLDMAADFEQKPREFFGKDRPKLVRQLPMQNTRYMRYTAVAVAPSDPRVIWVWSHSVAPRFDLHDNVQVGATDDANENSAIGHGLWRSTDGGATWYFTAPIRSFPPLAPDPIRPGGGAHGLAVAELSIATTNPHKVSVSSSFRGQIGSGADGLWIVEPAAKVGPEDKWPAADCSATMGVQTKACPAAESTSTLNGYAPGTHPCAAFDNNSLHMAGAKVQNNFGCDRETAHPAYGQALLKHMKTGLNCYGKTESASQPQWGQPVGILCRKFTGGVSVGFPGLTSGAIAPADEAQAFSEYGLDCSARWGRRIRV